MPARLTGIGAAFAAAAALVKAAEAEAGRDHRGAGHSPSARRCAGPSARDRPARAWPRPSAASAGAMKELEDRQKSRATRLKRDALDRALLDLAAFYRDVLAVQLGAQVELASSGHEARRAQLAEATAAGVHGPPDRGHHGLPRAAGAQRRPAAGGRGDDAGPPPGCPRSRGPSLHTIDQKPVRFVPVVVGRVQVSGGAPGTVPSGVVGMMMAVSFERYGRLYYLDPGPTRHRRRQGARAHRVRPGSGRMRVGAAVGRRRCAGLPVCEGIAADDAPGQGRDEPGANGPRHGSTARRLIRDHGLPMKVIGVDYIDGPPVFTVYFSAPHRVDFRALVRDLAGPPRRPGRAAADRPAGRGTAAGRDRAVRP